MGILDDLAARMEQGRRALSSFITPPAPPPEAERPERGEWLSGVRDDYSIDRSARRANNVTRLGNQMRNADMGDTAAQFEVFEEVERDPQIYRLYFKRRLAVVGKPLVISPLKGDDSAQALQAAELCSEMITGRGGLHNWEELLFDLTDAIGKAFSVQQLVWDLVDGRFVPTHGVRWPQREFVTGDPYALYSQDQDALRVITEKERSAGEPLSDFPIGQWVVHKQKAWSQPLARAAMFRAVTWYWMFKRFGMKDWAIFLERVGIPPRMGKYHPGADDTERAALWDAVLGLGKDHACIFPDGSTIELLKTEGLQGQGHHQQLVKHCNDEISVCISGSTMSTTQGDRGARAIKEVYNVEEADQAMFDSRALAKTIRDQIAAPIVAFNLGPQFPVPDIEFQLDDHDDLESRATVDAILVKQLGLPLGMKYFYSSYDRPEPAEDEELIKKPAPAPAPGAPPEEEEDDEAAEEAALSAARAILRTAGRNPLQSAYDPAITTALQVVTAAEKKKAQRSAT